jgi:hypothetical protein
MLGFTIASLAMDAVRVHTVRAALITPHSITRADIVYTMCHTAVYTAVYGARADEDMIMTRVRTTGIVVTDFEEKPYSFSVSNTHTDRQRETQRERARAAQRRHTARPCLPSVTTVPTQSVRVCRA